MIFAASFAVPQFFNGMLTPVEISIFHTIFNVCCTLVLYPFGDLLVKLSGAFVPEKTVAEGAQTAEDKVNIEEQRLRRHHRAGSRSICREERREEAEDSCPLIILSASRHDMTFVRADKKQP